MILYLNDCFEPSAGHGGTRFYGDEAKGKLVREEEGRWSSDKSLETCCVPCVRGRALVFYHNLVHEGTSPAPGFAKYIIRSDLMYRRVPPICTAPADAAAYALYRRAVDLAGVAGREAEALPLFQKAFAMSRPLADLYGM